MASSKLPSYVLNGIIVLLFYGLFFFAVASLWSSPPETIRGDPEEVKDKALRRCSYYEGYELKCTKAPASNKCEKRKHEIEKLQVTLQLNVTEPKVFATLMKHGAQVGTEVDIYILYRCVYHKPQTDIDDEYETYATACLIGFGIGLLVMNIYLVCSGRGNNPHLGCYYCGICLICASPAVMAIYLAFDHPYPESFAIFRIVLLFALVLYALFIILFIYVTNVTSTLVTHTTTIWSDGSRTHSTSRDDWGNVKCNEWGCIPDL